jgi:hypothetical protein
LAGCGSADATGGPSPVPLATLSAIVVAPRSTTIDTSQTFQFAAYGRTTAGDSIAAPVSWAASGGAVTSSGAFSAKAAGGYTVIARHASGHADTAHVTITVPAPGSPPPGSPPPGSPPPPPPGSPPPPPPPSASGPKASECAAPGAGWVWCDDFEQNRLASYFEYPNPGNSFARTTGVGVAGSTGMRAHFNAGQVDAGGLHLAIGRTPQSYFRPADAGTANYRELYWRVYVRNQAGWVGGGGDKLSRATVFSSSSTMAQAMIAHVWSGKGSAQDYLVLDPASGTDAAGNVITTTYNDFAHLVWLGGLRGTAPLFGAAGVGQWHCVEAHARLNDAGQSNGLFELWVDGAADATRTGLNFLGAYNAYGMNAVYLENYWNAGSPVAQDRFMDNFVVSTQRIGC